MQLFEPKTKERHFIFHCFSFNKLEKEMQKYHPFKLLPPTMTITGKGSEHQTALTKQMWALLLLENQEAI